MDLGFVRGESLQYSQQRRLLLIMTFVASHVSSPISVTVTRRPPSTVIFLFLVADVILLATANSQRDHLSPV